MKKEKKKFWDVDRPKLNDELSSLYEIMYFEKRLFLQHDEILKRYDRDLLQIRKLTLQ